MVRMDPIRPKKPAAPSKPAPVVARPSAPAPAPARRLPVDELSRGRGQALRQANTTTLGGAAPTLDAQALIAARRASLRRPPAAATATPVAQTTPAGQTTPATASAAAAAPVDPKVREEVKDFLDGLAGVQHNPDLLANTLRESSEAFGRELISQIVNHEDPRVAAAFLSGAQGGLARAGTRNQAYDNMEVVATAMTQAYQSGAIDDADLHRLAESWGPEQTAVMVQSLALGHNASGTNGLVEALGEQAQALGYDTAAALAFTSTDALLEKHYPTAEAQREAFGHLQSFIDSASPDFLESNPEYRNAVSSALVNASRLTANGNGYSEAELQKTLETLGPTVVGEAIGQASERSFNGQVPGPLDTLGKAADAVARRTDGDEREAWQVNAAIAFTQSPELIAENLKDEGPRLAAFDALNGYLADSRGEWNLANREGYSLVRLPQAAEGINRLLATNPDFLTEVMERSPEDAKGQADLVQLFESIALNPDVPQSLRDGLRRQVEGYVQRQTASIEPGNANEVGSRVATLLGTLQVAGDRAVDHADAPDDRIRTLALDFASGLTGAAASAALGAVTGPVGSAVGGVIIDQVLGELFKTDPPTAAEVQRAFFDRLQEAGIDSASGEAGNDQLRAVYGALQDALTEQIANAPDTATRQRLQDQLNVVQGVLDGLDAFGNTLDSSRSGGQLAEELNSRRDEP
jgi:hypothetical protein